MASESEATPWDDVVLDTSAFIQGEVESLRRISKRLWTVPQVLQEVRDRKAKESAAFALDVIPERIQTVVPSQASLEFVVAFAKKTGDFAALSKTDLLVLALTHEIRAKNEGPSSETSLMDGVKDAIRGEDEFEDAKEEPSSAPEPKKEESAPQQQPAELKKESKPAWNRAPPPATQDKEEEKKPQAAPSTNEPKEKHVMWSDDDFAIEQAPPKSVQEAEEDWPALSKTTKPSEEQDKVPLSVWSKTVALESIKRELQKKEELAQSIVTAEETKKPNALREPLSAVAKEEKSEVGKNSLQSRILKPEMSGVAVSKAGGEDDKELDWARPGSTSMGWTHVSKKGVSKPSASSRTELPACRVACSTADFACQNVLLQLKLGVVSLDGRRVTQVKSWVLKCDACKRMFPADQKRLFCGHCGHASLARLAYSTDASGQRRYHYARNRRIKTQGNIFPIPHKADILLTEDQLLSGIWAQRASRKTTNVSMFGKDVNEALGVDLRKTDASQIKVGYGSINPNARKGRERRGASKKKSNQ